MSIVHTLTGAQAPVRADTEVWTSVRIEQSLDKVDIDTVGVQALDPIETDPQEPVPNRTITFESEFASAFFRLVWLDADGDESVPTAWVQDDAEGSLEWMPTPEEVAPLLRARLRTPGGQEAPTWADDGSTRPSRQQVLEIIQSAAEDIVAQVGTVPARLAKTARSVAALGAAMLIELSFYPEQIATERSPYEEYSKLYDRRMAALVEAAAEVAATGDIVPGDTTSGETPSGEPLQDNTPQFNFDGFGVGYTLW